MPSGRATTQEARRVGGEPSGLCIHSVAPAPATAQGANGHGDQPTPLLSSGPVCSVAPAPALATAAAAGQETLFQIISLCLTLSLWALKIAVLSDAAGCQRCQHGTHSVHGNVSLSIVSYAQLCCPRAAAGYYISRSLGHLQNRGLLSRSLGLKPGFHNAGRP